MEKNRKINSLCKLTGLFCAVLMLVCALYVPLTLSVSAISSVEIKEDVPVIFDFEDTVTDSNINAAEAKGEAGIGYFGSGPSVKVNTDADGNKNTVLSVAKTSADRYGTAGGYRLHSKKADGTYGFYELAPSSRYMVSFKIRVMASPKSVEGSVATNTSKVFLCYNCAYNPSSQTTNYVNVISNGKDRVKVMESVIDSDTDSGTFILYDENGAVENYKYSDEWISVKYFINTPAEFTKDPALTIWADRYYGVECEIDNVSVVKIGANSGMVTFVDQYSGTEDFAFGQVGTAVTLPDIADRAQQAEHVFEGWYTNEERTEKAENVTFTAAEQTLYSRWKAPVTITFMNTLDGTEKKVSGFFGDAITFPEDPVDPSGNVWFMGWYTDAAYANEYTSKKFGYSNITLYSFFKGAIPGINEGFENYTKDAYDKKYENGQAYKSNRLYFGATMSKQSEVTYNNSNYAVKFHWNPVPINDKDNEHYYDTSRYRSIDNIINIGTGLENNCLYVVSFKYKAEKVNAPVKFFMLSADGKNIWIPGTSTKYHNVETEVKQSNEWQEMSFQITTDMKTGGNYMYLGVSLTQNEETIIYFDDIKIEAFAQPYESVINLHTNIDDEVVAIKGVQGEKINLPKISHPLDAELKGWYSDVDLSTPFVGTTFVKGTINLYAKWLTNAGFIQDFENYTKDQWTAKEFTMDNGTPQDKTDDFKCTKKSNYLYFFPTMSKQSEVTHSGNYAIKFHWNTDPDLHQDDTKPNGKNNKNAESFNQNRYAATDNYFHIGSQIENNQIYTITFKYKVEKGDQNVQFYLLTANDANGWGSRVIYYMPETVDIKASDKWQEYTYEFTTAMKKDNQSLYLGVKLSEHKDVVIYFDDVKVKAVPNSEQCVVFINNGYEPTAMIHFGIKGEEIKLPTLDHPDGAPFLGWYTDAGLTVPYTAQKYPNNNVIIYAKWGAAPITFKSYPYEGHPYEDLFINRETAKGLGNGDDHAMRWKRKHATKYEGESQPSAFVIYNGVEKGAIYRIKYDYKINSASFPCTLAVVSADYKNIWLTSVRTKYQPTEVKITEEEPRGWQTVEAYITAKELDAGNNWNKSNAFFLKFFFSGNSRAAGTNIDVLIDNVLVEKIEAPYVCFEGQNNKSCVVLQGEAGEEIKTPADPKRIGYIFKGWFMDIEGTVPFDLKTFAADTAVTAYAKWEKSSSSTYSFEDFTIDESKDTAMTNAKISSSVAKTGKKSMRLGDRAPGESASRSYFPIEDNGEYYKLEYNRQYLVTMNYYIKKSGPTNMNISFIASGEGNIWNGIIDNAGVISGAQTIYSSIAKEQKGKWTTKEFAIDTIGVTDTSGGTALSALFILVKGGENWEIYFDEITITEVPKGKSLVVLDAEGVKSATKHFIGSVGASYANKLPEKMNEEGKFFKGYYTKSAGGAFTELKRENMKFGEKATVVYARFLDLEVKENFDEGFYEKAYSEGLVYSIHDFDYEVYDSDKLGNSKENVTNGRYSLHRKGNTMFNENSVILTLGNQISENERYTVTFKVKMGKHLHTDGAVKIASCKSFKYAWHTTGDYYPVVAIADLTDGQWHEISYTFNSVEAFLALQTPGYVELFVDDFKFVLEDRNAPLSTPASFTEYVPAERDENGNLLFKDRTAVDISSIIDASLNDSSVPWLWIIIGAVVLLVIAGGVTAIVIIKKKKAKA